MLNATKIDQTYIVCTCCQIVETKTIFEHSRMLLLQDVFTFVDRASSLLNKLGQRSRNLSLMASVEALSSRQQFINAEIRELQICRNKNTILNHILLYFSIHVQVQISSTSQGTCCSISFPCVTHPFFAKKFSCKDKLSPLEHRSKPIICFVYITLHTTPVTCILCRHREVGLGGLVPTVSPFGVFQSK